MASDCKTLPHDIISDVLSRLRVRDLCMLRCVSKSWLALISDPVFQRKHRRIREKNPLLLVTTIDDAGSSRQKITISLLDKGSKTIDPMTRFTLKEEALGLQETAITCRDLVCTYDRHNVYLCNPATKKWIHLPVSSLTLDRDVHITHVAFGYIASTSSYKLFRMLKIDNSHGYPKCEVLTVGSNHWRAVDSPPGKVSLGFYFENTGTTLDGSVYLLWEDYRGNVIIMVFDLNEEAWSFVPLPSDHHDDGRDTLFLMEMGGQLCLECSPRGGDCLELWFLKSLHENRPIWEKGCNNIDITRVDYRWRSPLAIAIEQETGKILLRTESYLYKMLRYDPNDQTMEEIYRGQSPFSASYYIESFETLDIKGFNNVSL